MKNKSSILIASIIILVLMFIFCQCKNDNILKDGTYHGQSKALYQEENFWGDVNVTIKKGKIISINFRIIDSTNHELFDSIYEKHFAGNDLYVEQCRNDWQGVIAYPKILIEKQNIDNVDVISGATWSYNMFKYALQDALKNTKKL